MIKKIFFSFILLTSSTLFAADPLVSSSWLNQHKDDQNLLIVDLRNKEFFEYAHIPGSVQTDYNLWREPNQAGIVKMLPPKKKIEQLLSALGATTESHISSIKLSPDQKNVYFCHTGHRASLSWFVASEILGDKNAVLYDGSTADWSVRKDLPVDQLIDIKL